MADRGATLGADLGDLYNAGKYGLPAAAGELSSGGSTIPTPDSNSFFRTGPVGSGWYGPMDDITAYANELSSLLSTSASNINDTADALVSIANHYSNVNNEATTVFNQRKKELDGDQRLREGSKEYQG